MSWSKLFVALAGAARLAEDPELRAQLLDRVRTHGVAAARVWLQQHGEEAGLDPVLVRHLLRELDER